MNRGRGQANQRETIRAHTNNTSWSEVAYVRNRPRPPQLSRPQQPLLHTSTTRKTEPCYKFGQPFLKNHVPNCTAQNFTSKLCKKIRHFTSMCNPTMPGKRKPRTFAQENRSSQPKQMQPPTRRVLYYMLKDKSQKLRKNQKRIQ